MVMYFDVLGKTEQAQLSCDFMNIIAQEEAKYLGGFFLRKKDGFN